MISLCDLGNSLPDLSHVFYAMYYCFRDYEKDETFFGNAKELHKLLNVNDPVTSVRIKEADVQTIELFKSFIDSKNYDEHFRARALSIFSSMAGKDAIPLLAFFDSKNFADQIRLAAVLELAKLNAEGTTSRLIDAYNRLMPSDPSRLTIISVLGKSKDSAAIPFLESALEDTSNSCSPPVPMLDCFRVRLAAKKALQEFGTKEADAALSFKLSLVPLSLKLLAILVFSVIMYLIAACLVKSHILALGLKVLIGISTILFMLQTCGMRVL
jgi:hypothetical protein